MKFVNIIYFKVEFDVCVRSRKKILWKATSKWVQMFLQKVNQYICVADGLEFVENQSGDRDIWNGVEMFRAFSATWSL